MSLGEFQESLRMGEGLPINITAAELYQFCYGKF